MIRAPRKYRILITGDALYAANRDFTCRGLEYLLGRLFRGSEVCLDQLASYGLTVFVEEDMDQGDED